MSNKVEIMEDINNGKFEKLCTEWKELRPKLGNLLNTVDGSIERLQCGLDQYKDLYTATGIGYDKGFSDGRYHGMKEVLDAFLWVTHDATAADISEAYGPYGIKTTPWDDYYRGDCVFALSELEPKEIAEGYRKEKELKSSIENHPKYTKDKYFMLHVVNNYSLSEILNELNAEQITEEDAKKLQNQTNTKVEIKINVSDENEPRIGDEVKFAYYPNESYYYIETSYSENCRRDCVHCVDSNGKICSFFDNVAVWTGKHFDSLYEYYKYCKSKKKGEH